MPKRTDNNHSDISSAFRKLGYSVFNMSAVGKGFPDIIIAKHNRNYLIEIKTNKGKLTPAQVEFKERWLSPVYIVRSAKDVIKLHREFSKCN